MAVNSRDRIPQTHRTILFDAFTDSSDEESLDLYTFLLRANETKDPQELFGNMAKLEVHSFDEFLEKFSPKVYEYTEKVGDKFEFRYTTRKSDAPPNAPTVKLGDHAYFRMLCDLYTQKARRGLPNLEFDDSKILEILLPQREIEEIYDDRKLLNQMVREHEEKVARNEIPGQEAQVIIRLRQKIVDKYKKSPLPLLSIALADTKSKLDQVNSSLKSLAAGGSNNQGETVAIGTMTLDADGRPIFRALPKGAQTQASGGNPKQAALAGARLRAILASDYDQKTGESGEAKVKELVVSTYAPALTDADNAPTEYTKADLETMKSELEGRKADLQKIYTDARQSFIDALSKIVQKLLCVKVFFDHATGNAGNSARLENGGLIVTNCSAGKLVSAKVLERFQGLMQHFGIQEGRRKIWFGILPHINNGEEGTNNTIVDAFGALPDAADADTQSGGSDGVTLNEAITLLGIMNKAQIITFFNFAPTSANTFAGLTAEGLRKYREDLKKLEGNENAVFAYPNFTIMAEKPIPLPDSDNKLKIMAPAVYIDASYVAAGLVVGSQQPIVLKKHFRNAFLPVNVNVRVNLEDDAIASRLLTNFNCELTYKWEGSLKEAINEDNFGFVFCGDEKFVPGAAKALENSYVYLARTMARDIKGRYKPLFGALTKNFLYRYIKSYGDRTTRDTLKAFQDDIKEWEMQAKRDASVVNLIQRAGDSIAEDKDRPGKLKITFDNMDDELDVQIEETEGGTGND